MAKGHLITNETRSRIAEVLLENPTWRAKEIQAEVTRRMGGRGPGLSAIQKEVTKLRRRVAEASVSELDKPWNLSTLSEYDLPPRIIPILIEMQKLKKKRSEYGPITTELTVRQARWVSRLYYLTADTYLREYPQATDELKRPLAETGREHFLWTLFVIAASYAKQEIVRDLVGKDFVGQGLDIEFFIDGFYWKKSIDEKSDRYIVITALSKTIQSDYINDTIKKARRKVINSDKLRGQKSK